MTLCSEDMAKYALNWQNAKKWQKWHIVAILKTAKTSFFNERFQLVNVLLLNLIWRLCDSLLQRYGQMFIKTAKKMGVAAFFENYNNVF